MSTVQFDEEPDGREEEAAIWCMRLAEDRLTPEEQRSFDAWLAVPGHAEMFDDALMVWRMTESAANRPEIIDARAEALDAFRQANSRRWRRTVSRRWYWPAGIVAAMLLLVSSGVALLHDPAHLYETGVGERRVAMLEDGSRLSLDAATEVEVQMAGDQRRLTLLSGRAKCDVAKDPLRPFSVTVGNKLVVATGTSFSVELLDDQVRVFLYEGHVEVLERRSLAARPVQVPLRNMKTPADQALVPGRELVTPLAAGTATVGAADLPRSLLWEAGQLSFDNEPLRSAVARMNRYAREPLAVADPATAAIRVNGVFDAGDTEAFVEGVTALNAVRVVREQGKIVFARRSK